MSKVDQKLQLSKALRFRIGKNGEFFGYISNSSGEFYIAPEVLLILAQIERLGKQFDTQKNCAQLKKECENLISQLPKEKEVLNIIEDLAAAGLISKQNNDNSRNLLEDGFGDFWIQWAMISDLPRSIAYEKSIENLISNKSIVVDVGAGSGLLTAMCLHAGAKQVVAIEETQIAKKIMPLLKSMKLSIDKEKFVLHNKNSFDATLPINTTHIVSELFGNDPFQEGVLPTLKNIAQRFTKQPIYIPQKIELFFELIKLTDHPICHRIDAFQNINNQKMNGFLENFMTQAKNQFSLNDISFPLNLSKHNIKRISKPIRMGLLPLNPPLNYSSNKSHPLFGEKEVSASIQEDNVVGLIWFRVTLDDKNSISSHCLEKDAASHWSPILILLNYSPKKNEPILIKYHLNEFETGIDCSIHLKDKNFTKIGGRF